MDDTHAMKVKVWDASFRVDDVPDHVESDVFQKVPVEDGTILVLDYMVARRGWTIDHTEKRVVADLSGRVGQDICRLRKVYGLKTSLHFEFAVENKVMRQFYFVVDWRTVVRQARSWKGMSFALPTDIDGDFGLFSLSPQTVSVLAAMRISMEFSLAWFGRCQTRRMGVNNE
ncbi:MAG: hypothetical protein IKO72_07675 [Kiritimatiellae bacterium]|nr:hypothetical protein [Kiritimatiellia bacterium]